MIIFVRYATWSLFVDAKIIKDTFKEIIYVVGNDISTFKDIEIFEKETKDVNSVFYFFNKFNYFQYFRVDISISLLFKRLLLRLWRLP